MWCNVVVFLALVSLTLAATAIAPLEPKPEKFDKIPGCYIKELDRVISFGEKVPSKKSCQAYLCNTSYVQIHTCGAVEAVPPCKTYADKTKSYPDCCKKIKC